jgi:hypothetical protein
MPHSLQHKTQAGQTRPVRENQPDREADQVKEIAEPAG